MRAFVADAGATDLEEAVQLLSEIWGADFMMNQDSEIRETVQAFSKVGQGGAIDRHEFVNFVSQHPTLLMPVYLFQDAVRCVVFGSRPTTGAVAMGGGCVDLACP